MKKTYMFRISLKNGETYFYDAITNTFIIKKHNEDVGYVMSTITYNYINNCLCYDEKVKEINFIYEKLFDRLLHNDELNVVCFLRQLDENFICKNLFDRLEPISMTKIKKFELVSFQILQYKSSYPVHSCNIVMSENEAIDIALDEEDYIDIGDKIIINYDGYDDDYYVLSKNRNGIFTVCDKYGEHIKDLQDLGNTKGLMIDEISIDQKNLFTSHKYFLGDTFKNKNDENVTIECISYDIENNKYLYHMSKNEIVYQTITEEDLDALVLEI